MKKLFFSFIFFIVFVLTLVSCNVKSDKNEGKKTKIVATIFPQYDFIRQLTLGVDSVEVKMLISPGVDVHCFEPTPQNLIDIENADLFIYCGGKSDDWVNKILKSVNKKEKSLVSLVDVVKNDIDGNVYEKLVEKDDHVWTSPLNCIKIIKSLKEKLCEIDGKNASKYSENMNNYIGKFLNLHENFKNVVKNRKRDFIVFADRFPFLHFVNEYGLKYVSAYESCSSKSDVNPKTVSKIVKQIEKYGVPLILKLDQSSSKIAKTISKETGIDAKTFYSCHSCSKEDFERGVTVLDMFSKNVKTLKEALS